MGILSRAEHERIAEAIRTCETRTSGEIVCVVAGRSDGYFHAAGVVFALAAALLAVPAGLVLDRLWIDVPHWVFASACLVALATGLALLMALPGLRIALVPRRLRYRRAHRNAVAQFLATNIHATEARTGVLIFVSLAERYAEVLADSGIAARVPQAAWDDIVATLVKAAAQRRLADGFVQAVGEAGALLSAHFPRGAGDRNELPDRVVEI